MFLMAWHQSIFIHHPSGWLHWHWSCHIIVPGPMKQPLNVWVNEPYEFTENRQYNHKTNTQHGIWIMTFRYEKYAQYISLIIMQSPCMISVQSTKYWVVEIKLEAFNSICKQSISISIFHKNKASVDWELNQRGEIGTEIQPSMTKS